MSITLTSPMNNNLLSLQATQKSFSNKLIKPSRTVCSKIVLEKNRGGMTKITLSS